MSIQSPSLEQQKALPDSGKRRHLSWGMDFDTRAILLAEKIGENWEASVKTLHLKNIEKIRQGLRRQFGELSADDKIENFVAIGTKPFSVLSYHNSLFDQVRNSFVIGAYYPALVGACALGERILNHLIIDLRSDFSKTNEYRLVYRKESFDDWRIPIDTLEAWNILLPQAVSEFRALMPLRHRSIHFNISTYQSLREDALAAILHMRTIIEQQFGTHALRPWFIAGTKGHVFIKKDYETHPFVRKYFIPGCPLVGPLFSMEHGPHGWDFIDFSDYGDGNWTDQEFADEYNNRDVTKLAKRDST